MITRADLKNIAGEIANIFCQNNVAPSVCSQGVKQRLVSTFNNDTFLFFLENIQYGRFYLLRLSNWNVVGQCHEMGIQANYTDVVTGQKINVSWRYTTDNCNNQFRYQDLNYVIQNTMGMTFLSAPISSNQNSDVGATRLIYKPSAPSYGIVYVPSNPPGGIIVPEPVNPPTPPPTPVPEAPMQGDPGGDLLNILTNPVVLAGLAIGGYFIWKGTK